MSQIKAFFALYTWLSSSVQCIRNCACNACTWNDMAQQ